QVSLLSPVQQGMLFHHLTAPHSGVDTEQMVMTLREELDASVLRRAWNKLVERHASFRSSFDWEGAPQPVRLEHSEVVLDWELQDLRSFGTDERERRIRDYLETDRSRGFDLRVVALTRAALFQTADEEWVFVWTFHHILADGQTYRALIQEGFA